jgi:molecular chaperone GrpE
MSKDKVKLPEEEDLKKQISDLEDRLLRVLAETENIKKRVEKEKEDAFKYCISSFAKEVLIIRDNIKLALSNCECSDSKIANGIKMTISEMDKILSKHNIKIVEALGRQFDPHLHQAMFEAQDTEKEPGTIIEVIQDGFIINDRLLRPALVGVTKK